MKKLGVIVLLSVFLFGFIANFVSAEEKEFLKPLAENAKAFYDTIFEPFGKFLLGSNTDTGELFFAKLLFFIILITLVNYALSQFSPLQSKSWFISAIVSILAVRWITPTWIETIVLPYTSLGITLTALFPFVLYFIFVEKGLSESKVMRKTAWIFAAVVFVGLFFYRADMVALYPKEKVADFNPAYIYLITAGLCLIMFFADKTIQNAFAKVEHERSSRRRNSERSVDLRNRLEQSLQNVGKPGFDNKTLREVVESLIKEAKSSGAYKGALKARMDEALKHLKGR